MRNRSFNHEHLSVGDLVPGFAFYQDAGNRLAGVLLAVIENVIDFVGRFR